MVRRLAARPRRDADHQTTRLRCRRARALGARGRRILGSHLLPNVAGPVIVSATLGVANVIAIESALSFIGYGVPPEHPSWGTILQDAVNETGGSRWVALIAGAAIVGTVLCFNLLGDALRDALDARHSERPAP